MAELRGDEVNARILYWGIEGSGKSTSLRTIHAKLRADHRGELRELSTRLDPTVTYELLPIELGEVRGRRTRLQVIAVPGSPDQLHTRKQLLDQVDGIVLVMDAQRELLEQNIASVRELSESLAAYGRSLHEIPVVVQFNKRDLGDPFAIEELHRQLQLPAAAAFETVATDGTGILQTLTTISKRVVRVLRDERSRPAPPEHAAPRPAAPVPSQAQGPRPELSTTTPLLEDAILADGEDQSAAHAAASAVNQTRTELDQPWDQVSAEPKISTGVRIGSDLRIVSVGTATREDERTVRIPLVLGNADGESVTLALSIKLDPILDNDVS